MGDVNLQQSSDHDRLTIQLPMTFCQLREINRRAGVGPFDRRARREFVLSLRLRQVARRTPQARS
jgi:hypothetical protein